MNSYREHRRFTPDEYLRLEESAEYRSEYIKGEIYAMTGGSLNHNRIVSNLLKSLPLAGSGCEAFHSDVRLHVEAEGLFTYPDLLVVCGGPRLMAKRQDTLVDATLIAEVLSPGTESYDRGAKFSYYRGLPSLREYVLVAQDEIKVERHFLQPTGDWLWTEYRSREQALELHSLSLKLPLANLYADVAF